jgi:hypothetical protein
MSPVKARHEDSTFQVPTRLPPQSGPFEQEPELDELELPPLEVVPPAPAPPLLLLLCVLEPPLEPAVELPALLDELDPPPELPALPLVLLAVPPLPPSPPLEVEPPQPMPAMIEARANALRSPMGVFFMFLAQ